MRLFQVSAAANHLRFPEIAALLLGRHFSQIHIDRDLRCRIPPAYLLRRVSFLPFHGAMPELPVFLFLGYAESPAAL